MAGTGLYWARGEDELRALAEALGAPVFLNGMGRGCLPADHELAFSRARGHGLKEADVALAIGLPLDFRLGFGGSFGDETKLVWLDAAPNELDRNRTPDVELVGGIAPTLAAIREAASGADPSRTADWVEAVRATEDEKRAAEQDELDDDRAPLHPMRVYKGLAEVLDRDAIVIGDGGDFVSYAGKVVPTYEPGTWMDPGPFGCLGAGPGQAIGAKIAHPDRQVCLLLGDGAFGFSGMEFDTMARHGIPVVGVIGNNGIWALEHHPMMFLYGYSVAAKLRPETRYDQVAEALGCHSELVSRARRARARARARIRVGQARPGERPHRPRGRLPAQVEPGVAPRAAPAPLASATWVDFFPVSGNWTPHVGRAIRSACDPARFWRTFGAFRAPHALSGAIKVAGCADVGRFLPGIRELDAPRPRDVALARLAEAQFGVVTSGQLVELGFSSSAISRMVASGRLIRLYKGVYAVGHSRLVARGRWLAAVLACGDEACLSHREGAALSGVRHSERSRVDVTVPSRSRFAQPGIQVHRRPRAPSRRDHRDRRHPRHHDRAHPPRSL